MTIEAREKRGNDAPRTARATHEPTGVPANCPVTFAPVTRPVEPDTVIATTAVPC